MQKEDRSSPGEAKGTMGTWGVQGLGGPGSWRVQGLGESRNLGSPDLHALNVSVGQSLHKQQVISLLSGSGAVPGGLSPRADIP